MARLELLPFSDQHLEDAARLLSARHTRHREAEPLLPERFQDPAAALDELEGAWRAEGASGVIAARSGRPVGYLLGAPRDRRLWGENVWVELAGHAVEEGELVRDLYAAAAARWVDEGHRRHYALVPASDAALVDAWFRVGFGQQHAHGLQEVRTAGKVVVPEGFEIREPRAEDVEALIEIDLALPRHQQSSPVFSSMPMPTREEIRQEWAQTLATDDEKVLVGFRDGGPVAVWGLVALERSHENRGLMRPENACFLGFAATVPQARGSGIGLALTAASFAWAAEQGYAVMATDWRVTNLLASRFWPHRGFRTTFWRLYRSIP
jgi:GNAT superfamily N-acetyltransferase